MATSSYLNRSTPGVYVTEIDAFGTAIVGVATAVPIFIGYTEFAGDSKTGQALYNTPVKISSMTEFTSYFGGAPVQNFAVTAVTAPAPTPTPAPAPAPTPTPTAPVRAADFYATITTGPAPAAAAGSTTPTTAPTKTQGFWLTASSANFNLYWQMRLFFANGGGDCYIVSVGSYWVDTNGTVQTPISTPPYPLPDGWKLGSIAAGDTSDPTKPGLLPGLAAAGYAVGPTMTVIPEACQLTAEDNKDYNSIACAMMLQANTLQDRVAILDLPGVLTASTIDALRDCQTALSTGIAPQVASVSYAAAYAPAVNSSVISASDILYSCLQTDDNSVINNLLTSQVYLANPTAPSAALQSAIAAAFPLPDAAAKTNDAQYSNDSSKYAQPLDGSAAANAQWQKSLNNLLYTSLPIVAQIEQQIANSMNIAPPSGIMAGIWTKSDGQTGVWNAPANMSLASVSGPIYLMSDSEQAGFNVPTNGQAIDILRAQPGRGTVVWGARTLDGNSQDYRYIQVRRTLIYVEQSIKTALRNYVFAANDATTWSTVTASISSFLSGLWQQGGLMGDKASDAFSVACGLGTTMTDQNVLDGYMVVAVTLQMIHPAEFIELTFTQKMGS
ncbi:phage tail sheath family protein [Sphingomonas sp. 28-63-12]|uniref:phage tail sheath family protein n=1 Tax=Sphingomonas sp. 28-63-12 TaxID=1970434 RepID=UPI000BC57492|nr:MAG: hypothetical protein B7Y47_05855 [Sphingomonas sp. 28-63-12]